MKRSPLRWSKGKPYSGMMRLPNCYRLRRDGEVFATVQEMGDGRWFWYGMGENTAHAPTTLEEAKKQAEQIVRTTTTAPQRT